MVGKRTETDTITNKQYFRDDGLYIYSDADGYLDVIGDTKIDVVAPTIEMSGSTQVKLNSPTIVNILSPSVDFDSTTKVRVKSPIFELSGAALRRKFYYYISSATDAGWNFSFWNNSELPTLPSEGIVFVSAKSGSVSAKLPTTPIGGEELTVVFTDSGSASNGAKTFTISSSTAIIVRGMDKLIKVTQLVFAKPGVSARLVGSPGPTPYWYLLDASGSVGSPGQVYFD